MDTFVPPNLSIWPICNHTYRQTARQAGRQADRQTSRQADRQTDRQRRGYKGNTTTLPMHRVNGGRFLSIEGKVAGPMGNSQTVIHRSPILIDMLGTTFRLFCLHQEIQHEWQRPKVYIGLGGSWAQKRHGAKKMRSVTRKCAGGESIGGESRA